MNSLIPALIAFHRSVSEQDPHTYAHNYALSAYSSSPALSKWEYVDYYKHALRLHSDSTLLIHSLDTPENPCS